jgi:phage-related protein
VVEFPDGSVVESEFVYQSGLEGGTNLQLTWAKFLISVECPNPFWVARDALQFAVDADTSGTPFMDNMSGLPVTSSNVIGEVQITNRGDVHADLTTIIRGPSSGSTTILINGVGYVFTASLTGSETITVARGPLGVTVTDQTGANRYADLGAAPKFPQLPPGENVVNVTMVGATSASRISGNYKPRFEGVY